MLSWPASTGGASSYQVLRGTTTGGPYTVVGSPTSTGFTNTGLTDDDLLLRREVQQWVLPLRPLARVLCHAGVYAAVGPNQFARNPERQQGHAFLDRPRDGNL